MAITVVPAENISLIKSERAVFFRLQKRGGEKNLVLFLWPSMPASLTQALLIRRADCPTSALSGSLPSEDISQSSSRAASGVVLLSTTVVSSNHIQNPNRHYTIPSCLKLITAFLLSCNP